jgi:hypothetical protein
MKIPVFLPVTREFGLRDEFARDCLLQRRVCCEPGFRAAGNRREFWLSVAQLRRRANLAISLQPWNASRPRSPWRPRLLGR